MLMGEGIAHLVKIVTDICTGVSLVHGAAYPTCRESLRLLPKALYHSVMNIAVWDKFQGFL